jgi:hypothetical protein
VGQHKFADRAKAVQLSRGLTAQEVDHRTWSGPTIIHAFALPVSPRPETPTGPLEARRHPGRSTDQRLSLP